MLLGSPARVHAEVTMPTEHNTAHEISPARGRDRPVGMQTALHSCEEEHWRTAAPMESVSRPVALSARCDSARAHETVVDVPAFPSQPHLERRTRGSVFRNSEVRMCPPAAVANMHQTASHTTDALRRTTARDLRPKIRLYPVLGPRSVSAC
jgi:hypothetical protein